MSVCIPDGAAYPQTGDGERSWLSKLLQVTVLEEEQALGGNLVSQVPSSSLLKHPPSLPLGCRLGPSFSLLHQDTEVVQENPWGNGGSQTWFSPSLLLPPSTEDPFTQQTGWEWALHGRSDPTAPMTSCSFQIRSKYLVAHLAHPSKPKSPSSSSAPRHLAGVFT